MTERDISQLSGAAISDSCQRVQSAQCRAGPHPSIDSQEILNSRLINWLSPAFPIGAFAYSHGLETAVEKRLVSDVNDLQSWLTDLCQKGSLNNDLVLLSMVWRTVAENDRGRLREISELASALTPSAERSLEAHALGEAFITAVRTGWPCRHFDDWLKTVELPVAYPVAVGLATSVHRMDKSFVLSVYATSVISNLLSSAIRLGIIGQSDGLKVQAHLEKVIDIQTHNLIDAGPDQLGGACLVSDLCSLQHETQEIRLFRT